MLLSFLILVVYVGPRKLPAPPETEGIQGPNFICKTKYTGVDVRYN